MPARRRGSIIGERCVIREAVTINPGTAAGGMLTKIGNDCLIMASAHVAHDCDHRQQCHHGQLCWHGRPCQIGDNVIFGGMCVVHQFTRIGAACLHRRASR